MFQPDCVIVFDLEATCFRLRKPPAPEVIEIGAVKTDLIGNELSRYQAYVLPTRAPKLSKFCTKLTGIQQYQIDDADEFPLAVEDFKHWIFEGVNEPILTSWGRYDIRQLRNQSMEHFLPSFDLPHFALNEQHCTIKQIEQPIGLSNALKLDNYEFIGDPHGAMDDAINASRIFRRFAGDWNFQPSHWTK